MTARRTSALIERHLAKGAKRERAYIRSQVTKIDEVIGMPKTKAKTKAGKQRKVASVMREYKRKSLKSSSGRKVRSRKQAVAIALSEAGLSKKKRRASRKRR